MHEMLAISWSPPSSNRSIPFTYMMNFLFFFAPFLSFTYHSLCFFSFSLSHSFHHWVPCRHCEKSSQFLIDFRSISMNVSNCLRWHNILFFSIFTFEIYFHECNANNNKKNALCSCSHFIDFLVCSMFQVEQRSIHYFSV